MPERIRTKLAKLRHSLVLNQYMFSLLGPDADIERMSEMLKAPVLEGWDEENHSRYSLVLKQYFRNSPIAEKLEEYDEHIFRHTERINKLRKEAIQWKYFQYLSLLFTEAYLDRYFNGREQLLTDLNLFLFGDRDHHTCFNSNPKNYNGLEPFTDKELNKLAYWNATGSGKTLLMHVNILQYLWYYERSDKRQGRLNRIILLTPNEGLSNQHLEELAMSGIDAVGFNKDVTNHLYKGSHVEVMEITKLSDDKEKNNVTRVDPHAFEGNNLIIVDEGHRGSSGDSWKDYRNTLADGGFTFEYSATFGQSVSAGSDPQKKKQLLNEYGKATIFDYSYKHFYEDGYGKDYNILNLTESLQSSGQLDRYLTACLLSFYEQMRLYEEEADQMRPFNVEKPLAIFVGTTVLKSNNKSSASYKKSVSDVISILRFFYYFISNHNAAVEDIRLLMTGKAGLRDEENREIFEDSFRYLRASNLEAQSIYGDMLQRLFKAPTLGANIYVDNLKGKEGEIGLRIGNGAYFGVINVGDSDGLMKKIREEKDAEGNALFMCTDVDFTNKSPFATINEKNSSVNILIGSKKFTEGWNVWRVSTMGLMNIGRGEGSQIIQLFGRGVRLKGYGFSLKRSNKLEGYEHPKLPAFINLLETLNIFGVRADYMQKFRDYLESEGINKGPEMEPIELPIFPTVDLEKTKLKYIKVKDGKDFKTDYPHIELKAEEKLKVTLNYYPRLQRLPSQEVGANVTHDYHKEVLENAYWPYINWDEVYFELEQYKRSRKWSNLSFTRQSLKDLFCDTRWYTLYILEDDMHPLDFMTSVSLWQSLAIKLLKLYVDAFYNHCKHEWEAENLETTWLTPGDENFISVYNILVDKSKEEIVGKLKALKVLLGDGKQEQLTDLVKQYQNQPYELDRSNPFKALFLEQHLYQPLLYLKGDEYEDAEKGPLVVIKPAALVPSEKDFIDSLLKFIQSDQGLLNGKSLYLLRNRSKKGLGFFDSLYFYPDFILWIIDGEHQYVTFIEPHGLQHEKGYKSAKIGFFNKLKEEIEQKLHDKDISLDCYIITPTQAEAIEHWGGSILDMNKNHIYFQKEQSDGYMRMIVERVLGQA